MIIRDRKQLAQTVRHPIETVVGLTLIAHPVPAGIVHDHFMTTLRVRALLKVMTHFLPSTIHDREGGFPLLMRHLMGGLIPWPVLTENIS